MDYAGAQGLPLGGPLKLQVQSQLEMVNTIPFKDSSQYETLTKLNQVVRVT